MLTYLRILSLVRCVIDRKTSGWKFATLILHLLLFSVTTSWAQISGTVFQDANGNGALDATEFKVASVVVTAYSSNTATAPISVTTSAAGSYSFTAAQVPSGVRVRLEFTNLPSGSYDGASFGITAGSASTIRFVTPSATSVVNLGLSTPIDYCQTNPFLAVPCYVSGDVSGTAVSGQHVIVTVPFSASTTNTGTVATPVASNSVSPTPISDAGQVGSVWGMAYQRTTKQLFSAAFLKRHVGLGPGGLGGIYLTNTASGTDNGALYVNLTSLGYDVGQTLLAARVLPTSPTTSSTDPLAFDLVGKAGLGGLAISEDGTRLYAVDLYNKRLFIINAAKASGTLSGTDVTTVAIPNPNCANGVARPFGITIRNGQVYVGVVCTAESVGGTSANLQAYVYSLLEATNVFNLTPVITFPLNYPKGNVHATYPALGSVWEPWIAAFTSLNTNVRVVANPAQGVAEQDRAAKPQPMLSDIDFADNGDMILSFMDRAGHQLGYRQQSTTGSTIQYSGYIGGDLLRARRNGAQWILENAGVVTSPTLGSQTGCGPTNGQGPGGGEFFCQDNFSYDNDGDGTVEEVHQENMMGAALVMPGSGLITAIQMDPITTFSGGFAYFNDSNGSNNRRYEIYRTIDASGTQVNGTYGKANGLGAPVALCNPAPIEIGNRVWVDTNNNGVQDPDEVGLGGVVVNLQGPGLAAGGVSVTTTAGGAYYFSSSTSGTTTTGFVSSLTGLTSGGSYTLTFPTSVSTSTISLKPNSATGVNASLIDSDASAAGKIVFTLGQAGQNDYSFDVGFVPCTPPSVTLTSSVSAMCVSQQIPVTLTTQVSPAGSYTYAVSGPAGVSITGANTATATATNLVSGVNTFTVTVTSGPGCFTTATASVTTTATPLVNLNPSALTICAGQSLTLNVGGLAGILGATFSQIGPLGNIINTFTSPVVSPTATTTYLASVTVPILGGLLTTIIGTCPVTVTVNPALALPPLGLSACVGTSLSLSSLTGPGSSLSALAGLTNIFSLGGQVLTNPITVTAGVTTLSVVSTSLLGCSASAPISLTGVPGPVLPPLGLSACVGSSLSLSSLTGPGSSLSALNGLTNIFSIAGQVLTSPITVTAGVSTFNVVSTNPLGCSATAPIAVTGVQTPVVPPLNLSLCVGINLSLSALTGPGGSLSALNGLTNVLRLGNLVTGQVLTDPVSISVGVNTFNVISTLTGPLGCTTSTPVSVTGVQAPIVPPLNLSLCVGTVLDLTALTGTGGSLSALNGLTNVLTNILTGTNINSLTVGVGVSAFNVTSTTPLGCTANTPLSFTGVQAPVLPPLNLSVCVGTNLSLSALTGPGGSLSALNGLTNVLRLGNLVTGQILTDPVSISAGVNTFNVVSTLTGPLGCTTSTPISVTGVDAPVVPPLNLSLCVGTVLDLTALTGTGGSLSALAGLTNVLRLGNLLAGAGLSSLTVSAGISAFNVSSTTPLGCTINTPLSFTGVQAPVLPPLNLSVCVGTNLSLSALTGPGGSLSALNGLNNVLHVGDLATGQVLTDPVSISAGVNTFNVISTLTGPLGCTTSTPISVTGAETPIVPPVNLSLCVGTVLGLTDLTGPGGSLSALNGLTNVLISGLTGTPINSITVGVGISAFNVTSTTPLGCTVNTPISFTGVQAPVLPPLNLSLCVGTNLSLSALTGPGGSLSALAGLNNVLHLGNLVTGQILTDPVSISAGVNTFNVVSTLTGPLGCTTSTPISVTGVDAPVVPPLNLSLCVGTELELADLTGPTGSLSALNGLTNVLRLGNLLAGAGLSSLTVSAGISAFNITSTTPLGCTVNTPLSFTGVQAPVLPPLNLSLCVGTNLSLSALTGPGGSLSALNGLTNVLRLGNLVTGQILTDPVSISAGVNTFNVVSTLTGPLGCTTSTPISVTGVETPIVPPLNLSLCVGTELTLADLTGPGGSLSALNGLTNVLRLGNLLTGTGISSLTVNAGISAFNVTSTTPLGCTANTPISITGIQTSGVSPLNLNLCIGSNLSLSGLVGPGGSLSALAGFDNVLHVGDLVTGQVVTDPVSISAGINTFNVTSTSPLGCSISTPISITGLQPPVATPLNLSLCVGTVLDLTALTGTGGSLSALNGLTNVLRLGNLLTGTGLSSLTVSAGISAFNVSSTTPLGCTINTPLSFTGVEAPVLPPLALSLCVGSNLSLSALTGPGGSLSALAGLNNVLHLGNLVTGQVLTDPVSISAGVSTFNVVSTLTGALSCTTSTPISVTGVEAPIVPPVNLSLCVGTVLDLTALTGTGGSLSALNGFTNVLRLGNLLTGPGLSSLTVGAGISAFNVSSTTPLGCTANAPISITGVQNPALPPLSLSLCVGTNLSLTSLVGPGGSLSALAGLTNELRLGDLVTGQVVTNPVSISVGVNTFNVTSTGPLGCTSSTPISITGVQPPVVPPLSISLCAGTVLNLTALTGPGGSLSALNGLTNVLINVLTGTTMNSLTVVVGSNAYNIVSTTPLGCTINTPISITGVQLPPVLPPVNLSLCIGTSLSMSGLVGQGGSLSALAGLTNVFSAGGLILTDPITVTAGVSTFTVVSTNPLGCSATTTVSVTALANPALSLTALPGNCNPATNQYVLTGTVSLTNAQAGVVTITDGASTTTVAVTTGQTSVSFVLPGLTSGTGLHTITASLPACGSANAGTSLTYTAPISCTTAPPCLLNLTVTPGLCSTATSQYSVTGTVTAVNATGSQSVTVTDGTASTVITLIGNGPTSFTLLGLSSNGLVHTVTASAVSCGLASTTYTAPQPCILGMDITVVDPGVCQPNTNIYIATGVVSFTNASAGSATITNGSDTAVLSITAGQTSINYSLTGISGTGSQTVTVTFQGRTISTTYTAPESCTSLSLLTLDKRVSSTTATIGSILTYTVIITNTGTNAVSSAVRDSLSVGGTYVVGSASVPAGTSFTPGSPVSVWAISGISAGQSLSLTFQVTVDNAGILYNQATIPGDTASVCTSVPFRVCAGTPYTFRLTAAPGLSSYQWFRNGVLIPNQTANVLDVSAPGSYSLAVNNATGQCPNFSCCPFVVIEDSIPVFAARAVPATCLGSTVQTNGQIILSGFGAGNRYQYSPGATFNAAASVPATPQIIPANGVIASTLASPPTAQIYTIRVYNAAGCFTDVNVILTPTVCGCPADVCVPYVISQTKRAPRIGDPIR